MGWACSTHREMRNAYEVLVERPEGKRPLARPRRRWDDIIIVNLRKIVREGVDWIRQAQDKDQWRGLVNMVLNLRVP